ncbi:MAG: hypothetical protein FJY85_14285 [Deltaproteobacteria bacterium]|nr:hypothetical protein [Deltaproteobacteria bacterium]
MRRSRCDSGNTVQISRRLLEATGSSMDLTADGAEHQRSDRPVPAKASVTQREPTGRQELLGLAPAASP